VIIVKEFITEGIYFDDDNFVFDYRIDEKSHFINLKYNNKFVKVNKKDIFYSYVMKDNVDRTIKKLFIKSLKYKDEQFISYNDYEKFLNKGILGFLHIIDRNIDIIIYPKSSSPLNFDIAKKIKDKLGTNTYIVKDSIVKNEIENIKIDASKISDKTRKSLLKYSIKDGEFFLKRIPPQYRKYFFNFLKFDNNIQRDFYNKLSGNILIVDDILSEGTTINEIEKLVKSFNPSKIIKYVILRT
jgi:hypothetical protein